MRRLLLLALLLAPTPAPAEIVQAKLVAESNVLVPGQPLRVGVLPIPQEGWHTYWENPGDAGIATSLAWTLPEGFTAGPVSWPVPRRLAEGPLVIYGYEGPHLLQATITPPAELAFDALYDIRVKAEWLVCMDICIPESAELELKLPAYESMQPSDSAPLFAEHEKNAPAAVSSAVYGVGGKWLLVSVPTESLGMGELKSAYFLPRQMNVIRYASEQKFSVEEGKAQLLVARSGGDVPPLLSGILLAEDENGARAFDLSLNASDIPVAEPAEELPAPELQALEETVIEPAQEETSPPEEALAQENTEVFALPTILLLALAGGMILNLMPCVLPVLSLKALALVKKSGAERAHIRRQGVAYATGILLSFALFASVLIALKSAGEAVGWGYQMQSPAFVGFLIYLLFLVGLNLSGLFQLPVLLGSIGTETIDNHSVRGSFFTGVLATAVATPCTAPFMASAVGAALTLPAWQALLVFEALGLGLALPFLLVSFFPSLLRLLPRPGAWMETFRQFLAFPMYASVIWLLWVLTLQTGAGGMAVALCGMLGIAAIIWLRPLFVSTGAYRGTALMLLALILALSLPMLGRMEGGGGMMSLHGEENGFTTMPYSKTALEQLRLESKPVFIDATAAWCITCQVNARVFNLPRVARAFEERGVTLMVADWTRRNQEITELLEGFGYQGVPLYVYFPPEGEPVVLPQLLTESIVINALK